MTLPQRYKQLCDRLNRELCERDPQASPPSTTKRPASAPPKDLSPESPIGVPSRSQNPRHTQPQPDNRFR